MLKSLIRKLIIWALDDPEQDDGLDDDEPQEPGYELPRIEWDFTIDGNKAMLREWQEELLTAAVAYEHATTFEGQSRALQSVVKIVAGRAYSDGWDSIFYARGIDRLGGGARLVSWRQADSVSFIGLCTAVDDWAMSTRNGEA